MNIPKRRRMLIVDVDPSPVFQEIAQPPRTLTKQELHIQTQQVLVDAAGRYKYELGMSDAFEGPIWKRVDKILTATTQEEAQRLAAEAEEFGLLSISVWHKKVRK